MALKSKFCAKCGSESANLIKNLCAECYLSLHKISVPKRKELRVCSKCSASLVGHFWVIGSEPKKVLAEQINQAIHLPENVKIIKVDLLKIKPDGLIEITFDLNGNILSEQYVCNLKIQKQLCPVCKKNIITDYKAKLQFRTKQNYQEFISDVLEFLVKYKKLIIRVEEIRTGVDVHLRSRNDSLKIAHNFKQKFNCHMRETREEYSWDRSKNKPKYKSTILLTKK